jgi:hypothetical protein
MERESVCEGERESGRESYEAEMRGEYRECV